MLKSRYSLKSQTPLAQDAFTVIEMLAVVTVLFILAALALPAYQGVRTHVESAKCLSNLRQLHSGLMLFYADYHFFPIGYSDDANPIPGPRWSPIRHSEGGGVAGTWTQWQIDIAPYLGDGKVQHANWLTAPYDQTTDPRTAYDPSAGNDPSAWRLPMEYRCPGYVRKLTQPEYDWQHPTGPVRNDFYGYCYNQYVMVGNGSPTESYSTGNMQHKGRDPRLISTSYAGQNQACHTAVLFCSRWGVWQAKNYYNYADLSGKFSPGAHTDFGACAHASPYKTAPHGSAGPYCGVSVGIHGGVDNFLFLDGHAEQLNPNEPADRRRMNKSWWRPLPLDASFGHYMWESAASYHVAFLFQDDGRPAGVVYTDGSRPNFFGWTPPPGYNWNE